jgi:predicted nucleic acid-binding Zn ribbon protein
MKLQKHCKICGKNLATQNKSGFCSVHYKIDWSKRHKDRNIIKKIKKDTNYFIKKIRKN